MIKSKISKKINKYYQEKEEAVSRQDYEKAAELRNEELEAVKKIDEQKFVKVPRDKEKN